MSTMVKSTGPAAVWLFGMPSTGGIVQLTSVALQIQVFTFVDLTGLNLKQLLITLAQFTLVSSHANDFR